MLSRSVFKPLSSASTGTDASRPAFSNADSALPDSPSRLPMLASRTAVPANASDSR